MAKYVTQVPGNLDEFTSYFESAILERKLFSTIKHQFRTKVNDVCCSVQVFEGYTFLGGNWLTMNVTCHRVRRAAESGSHDFRRKQCPIL